MSYIVLWTISLSLFDYSIIYLVSLALFLIFMAVFNLYRAAPNWKITFLLYIIPLILSIGPFLDGYSPPYSWTEITNTI